MTVREASVQSDGFPKVEVRLRVRVPSAGVFPTEMRPAITVEENGIQKPVQLSSLPDKQPARYLFAIDTSGSMRLFLPKVKQAMQDLLRTLPADSEIGLMTFNDGAEVLLPFTKNAVSIEQSIERLQIGGKTTELNYGLIRASEILNTAGGPGKNFIVAISDGKDEGRAYTIDAVIEAARSADTRVFAVGVLPGSDSRDLMKLRRVAESTGGRYKDLDASGDLPLQTFLAPTAEDFVWTGSWTSSLPEDGNRHPVQMQVSMGNARSNYPLAVQSSLSTFYMVRQNRFLVPLLVLAVLAVLVVVVLKQREVRRLVEATHARADRDSQSLDARVQDVKEAVRAVVAQSSRVPLQDRTIVEAPRAKRTIFSGAGSSGQGCLDVVQGPREGSRFELTRPVMTLGREITNDICVPEGRISATHARLIKDGNKYFIEDLNSTNGTFVDDRRISGKVELSEGAVIRMGGATLKFNVS